MSTKPEETFVFKMEGVVAASALEAVNAIALFPKECYTVETVAAKPSESGDGTYHVSVKFVRVPQARLTREGD